MLNVTALLTRASKRSEVRTRTNKQGEKKKGNEFQNNVASLLFHINRTPYKVHPTVPYLTLKQTTACESIWHGL